MIILRKLFTNYTNFIPKQKKKEKIFVSKHGFQEYTFYEAQIAILVFLP